MRAEKCALSATTIMHVFVLPRNADKWKRKGKRKTYNNDDTLDLKSVD